VDELDWRLLEDREPLDRIEIAGVTVERGARVLLKPRPGGDILDTALAGRVAIIESFEQDYEGRVLAAVVIEDDPGRDLGLARQPGHRFFFHPAELEPIA
jgi:hypothetical protein